jgi:hypothetical protein
MQGLREIRPYKLPFSKLEGIGYFRVRKRLTVIRLIPKKSILLKMVHYYIKGRGFPIILELKFH